MSDSAGVTVTVTRAQIDRFRDAESVVATGTRQGASGSPTRATRALARKNNPPSVQITKSPSRHQPHSPSQPIGQTDIQTLGTGLQIGGEPAGLMDGGHVESTIGHSVERLEEKNRI